LGGRATIAIRPTHNSVDPAIASIAKLKTQSSVTMPPRPGTSRQLRGNSADGRRGDCKAEKQDHSGDKQHSRMTTEQHVGTGDHLRRGASEAKDQHGAGASHSNAEYFSCETGAVIFGLEKQDRQDYAT